jgi:blue light- and temperature-responsive anti-repressor
MSLVRLVYFSRNRLDASRGALADRVTEILSASVANNQRADISGGLVFNAQWFAQVLEGDRIAVVETFARIQRDARHGDVSTIECRLADTRRFGFWWMAAAGWSPQNAALFQQYCGSETFMPCRLDGDAACDLIAAVLSHQMNTPAESTAPHWLSAWRNPDTKTAAPRSRIVTAA